MRILLIEDEKISRITLNDTLKKAKYKVTACATGLEGLEAFRNNAYDVVVTDLRLPKTDGLEILKEVKKSNASLPVIIMTAYASVETAVQALKLGAYDYLTKPFSPDELLSMLKRIRELRRALDENVRLKKRIKSFEKRTFIGQSPAMHKLQNTIKMVAQNDFTVLLQGESGTGKEVAARFLHFNSPRKNEPFIPINCAAIPETLLESELFGYEKGAFTGAEKQHQGYFERANKGTLFIDDIDDFPYALQVKLLRVLQEKEIQRVGGKSAIPVDIRVVAATKVNLQELIKENRFREDLYYRLNIIPLFIPALRERKEDIPFLIDHFIEKHGTEEVKPELTEEHLALIKSYDWPGNVRELENVVERMLAIPDSEYFTEQLRSLTSVNQPDKAQPDQALDYDPFPGLQKYITLKEMEIIEWALKKAGQNISDAARILKLPRSTLRSKLDKLNIDIS